MTVDLLTNDLSHPLRGPWALENRRRVIENEVIEEQRRRVERCAWDMLAFGRTYLPHHLIDEPASFHSELVALLMNLDPFEWFLTEPNPDYNPEIATEPILHPDAPAEQGNIIDFVNHPLRKKRDPQTRKHVVRKGIVVAAPRGHAKSTLLTLLIPLYCACFRLRRFILIVSDTDDQVKRFCQIIRNELEENELIRKDFGDLTGRKYGRSWTGQNFTVCHTAVDRRGRHGVTYETHISGRSAGSRVRGLKYKQYRPDLIICHEKGTPIEVDGEWMAVEEHPTAQLVDREGLSVRLSTLPYPEVVTPEHLYWARKYAPTTWQRARSQPLEGWAEAHELTKNFYIGMPIEREIHPLADIPHYRPKITRDPESGRIVQTEAGWEDRIPVEFYDPEWWWLFGLWWGDGHTNGQYQIGLTIADRDEEVSRRVVALLERWEIGHAIVQKEGCHQIVFSRAHLARWLKTWRVGNSRKQPPQWVEYVDPVYQRALIQGYIAADGWVNLVAQEVRVTSIHLDGLYCLRRILARLDIASSIRSGPAAGEATIRGRICQEAKKYDLRFRDGASGLGYAIKDQERYALKRTFVEGDWMWSKVDSVEDAGVHTFVPIQTPDHTYRTHFGESHNCDDIENDVNTQSEQQRKLLYDKVIAVYGPALDPHTGILLFCGTIIHFDSVLARLLNDPDLAESYVRRRWAATIDAKDVMDDSSIPLWPERFNLLLLRGERTRLGAAKFNREFMNDPRDPEARDFQPQWVRWFHISDLKMLRDGRIFWKNPNDPDDDELRQMDPYGDPKATFWQELTIHQAVDPAISQRQRADLFTMGAGGCAKRTEDVILLWFVRERMDFARQLLTIEQMVTTYPESRSIAIDATAYQDALRQATRERFRRRYGRTRVPLKPLRQKNGLQTKEVRLRRRAIEVEQGCVWMRCIRPGDPGYEDANWDETGTVKVHPNHWPLYQEMMQFPAGQHDDCLDVLDMLLSVMHRTRLFEDFAERERVALGGRPYPTTKTVGPRAIRDRGDNWVEVEDEEGQAA